MGWTLLDKPKTQRATKALARQYAEMEAAPHDRPLSERRLQVYQRLLAEGKFRPVTWASAICKETEGLYRVNGKHTSTMLSGLDKLPEDFFVTVEEYECDTLEDVAKLYATFDSTMQSRSAKDIYLSFAGTVPELNSVGSRIITAAVAGMAYSKMGHEAYSKAQAAERAEMLMDHPEFVLWLSDLLTGGPSPGQTGEGSRSKTKAQHLYRQPVVAAMFGGWSKAKAAATEFWSAVRDETGANPQVPDRMIGKWLLTSTLSNKEHTRVRKAGDRETYVKCLQAWNAWRKGERTNLRYFADAKVPAIV